MVISSERGDIPQGRATPIEVLAGRRVRIVNYLGQQVVDSWIFAAGNFREYLSMEHCRGQLYKLFFGVGDVLISNLRRPLVEIVQDTSPGTHDTLCSACDSGSYAEQGQGENHPNCRSNLLQVLVDCGVPDPVVPCPWNLFMEIPVTQSGELSDRPSAAKPGDYVELLALCDILVVCSPCPQEKIPISGVGRSARGVRWEQW